MSFIQIVEYQTSRIDEAQDHIDEYRKSTEGKRTTKRVRLCRDRDNPGRYFTIAEFDSYEEAMRNSELPETTRLAERLTALSDGPATFHNLEVEQDQF